MCVCVCVYACILTPRDYIMLKYEHEMFAFFIS